MLAGAGMFNMVWGVAGCFGADKVTDAIQDAAKKASEELASLIPSIKLDMNLPSVQLMAPSKLFCKDRFPPKFTKSPPKLPPPQGSPPQGSPTPLISLGKGPVSPWKEVSTTPGFSRAPCAAELGCKTAGRAPEPGSERPPPEQVRNHVPRPRLNLGFLASLTACGP